jgi:hypothetical protein
MPDADVLMADIGYDFLDSFSVAQMLESMHSEHVITSTGMQVKAGTALQLPAPVP